MGLRGWCWGGCWFGVSGLVMAVVPGTIYCGGVGSVGPRNAARRSRTSSGMVLSITGFLPRCLGRCSWTWGGWLGGFCREHDVDLGFGLAGWADQVFFRRQCRLFLVRIFTSRHATLNLQLHHQWSALSSIPSHSPSPNDGHRRGRRLPAKHVVLPSK